MIATNTDGIAKRWVKYGAVCGLISAGTYMFLNVLINIPGLPIPRIAVRILFFSVGVFGVISVGGLYHLIRKHKECVMLQMALILSIVAFTLFTLMAVVQETSGAFRQEATIQGAEEVNVDAIWRAVDSVQLGIDITFDIFYAVTFILYALLMYNHPRFGIAFSISGITLFSGLLILNMTTFPHPPGEAGLFDMGPFTGLWALAVIVQSLRSVNWMDE